MTISNLVIMLLITLTNVVFEFLLNFRLESNYEAQRVLLSSLLTNKITVGRAAGIDANAIYSKLPIDVRFANTTG